MIIENDKVVSIEYVLTEDGKDEVLDSNQGAAPLEFVMGKGSIIPGLEKALEGLKADEKKVVVVAPEEAYGTYNEKAVTTYPKEQFEGIDIKEGLSLYGQSEDGQTVQVRVKSFDEKEVTVDYNHPLAGKTLSFSVSILSVREATEKEIEGGVPESMMGGGCCGSGGCSTEKEEIGEHTGCCGGGGGHNHDHGGGGCGCH